MEQQQQTKGVGKESQLSRIAAAVNPGSSTEANPESTKSMIQTFIKHFDSVALELIQEMDDDQKDLVKNMVAEITKLQTKNIEEFQKAIGKIVGITNKMIESDNPKMQQLGQGLQDQAKEELFKAKGITLTGEKDTFANRLGREFGMNTEKEPVSGVKGVGKLAKGFVSNSASGFKAGLKESFMPQGGMLDRIFTSDEDKRQRELENIEQTAGQTESESLADMFKKVVEQMLKEGKEEKPSSEKNDTAKALAPISSEQQEDASGISVDNATAGMAAIGATLASLQTNSEDSLEIFKKSLEKLEYISKWIEDNGESLLAGAGGAGGGGLLDTVSNLAGGRAAGSLLPSAGALATGAAVTAGVAGVAYGAYKGYTGYQDAKQKEQAANKEIDEKVARGELTQAQGLEAKDKTKKTGRVEKSKAVGEGAGIAAGAAGGAALGAMYGSALGPLGTAVGGVGGALVGGFVGGGGGKWLGEKAGQLSNWWNDDSDKKKGKAKPAAQAKPITPSTPAKAAAPVAMTKLAAAEEEKKPATVEKKPEIKKPATVEKKPEIKKPVASETVKEVTTPKEKSESKPKTTKAPNLDDVDKSIKGKVAEIDPNGRWAKLKDGKIVDPDFPGDADSNYTAQQAYKLSQKNNKVESPKNTTGENLEKSSNKKVGKTETGKNVDGAIIEAGTAATKDKMQVNVPPPTVVNQGGGQGGNAGPTITAPGGVGNVRSDDPTWLRFQQKRAVA